MEAKTITITLDEDWVQEIKNFEEHRQRATTLVLAQGTEREINNAQRAFANASMSLGWKMERELRKQGVKVT